MNIEDKEQNEETPQRELTQTDHLNKKLLASFLENSKGKG